VFLADEGNTLVVVAEGVLVGSNSVEPAGLYY
jgi:hypothetical protein